MFETFCEDIARLGGKVLLDAVEEEYRKGWHVQRALVEAQANRISAVCNHLESSAVDGLGRIESDIPADVYFYWLNREREKHNVVNTWQDRDFKRRFLRDNPQFKVRYRKKAQQGWTRDPLAKAAAEGQAAKARQLITLS